MKSTLSLRIGSFWWLVLLSSLAASSSVAQDQVPEDTPYQATTTADPTIEVDHLKVLLRPLVKDELDSEAQAWLDLLRAKIREVGETELKLKPLPEDDSGDSSKDQLVQLRTAESALVERAQTVLDALAAKGGDTESAEQFIAAVSDLTETIDATSFVAALAS
jgi:hypothetical protein